MPKKISVSSAAPKKNQNSYTKILELPRSTKNASIEDDAVWTVLAAR